MLVLGRGGESGKHMGLGRDTASRSGYAKRRAKRTDIITGRLFPPSSMFYLFKRSTRVMTIKKPLFSTTLKRSCDLSVLSDVSFASSMIALFLLLSWRSTIQYVPLPFLN